MNVEKKEKRKFAMQSVHTLGTRHIDSFAPMQVSATPYICTCSMIAVHADAYDTVWAVKPVLRLFEF